MAAFYFTLIAVLLSGMAGRDQLALARLSQAQGARPASLMVAIGVSFATAAAAAWAASLVAPMLVPAAREIFVGMALALGGLELLLLSPSRRLREPTRSLGALALLLTAQQAVDGARFLVFAVAVAMNAPVPAAIAGGLGGGVLVGLAWLRPDWVLLPALRIVRRVLGVPTILLGMFLGLQALGGI